MKVVIVEDHLMFREVLRKVCAEDLGLVVVGEAGDGQSAVPLVISTKPDVVLLDLHLPGLDGFGVVAALRHARPDIRILVLSSHCDAHTVYRIERARVQGFVDKNTSAVASLKQAIMAVSSGQTYFSDAFRRLKTARHDDPFSFDKVLSDRECTLLALIGEPLADAEIAERLELSRSTVEKHRFNIMGKLGIKTHAQLVRYAVEHGFTLSSGRRGDGAMLP